MISIKKYLDTTVLEPVAPAASTAQASGELFASGAECYRALLLAIGRSAVRISHALGADLEANLIGFERRLALESFPRSIRQTEAQVEVQLDEWAGRASEYLKTQTDVVKELLTALAKTAESVGSRGQGYSTQFRELTGRLESVVSSDDLAAIRTTVAHSIEELNSSVDRMTRDSAELVTQLRSEIVTYEARLQSAEELALRDDLTGLANRRAVEERIQRSVAAGQPFSIAILDLNGFKQVNDAHGHLVGDELLKQFARELQSNVRACDLAGRWGGDEFMVVLACDAQAGVALIQRIREWVFGKYSVRGPGGTALAIPMDAAIGAAEWRPGQTMKQLVGEADAAMYREKKRSGKTMP